MATAQESPGMKRLLRVALVLAAAGVLAGAYGWWRWGSLVLLETVTRFCL